jgi:hypothetical protein
LNQKIPVTSVLLCWKKGDAKKMDSLSGNSVVSVEFGTPKENRLQGKLYLESSRKQRTKLLGTFEAEVKEY